MKVKPLNGYVLVETIEEERKSSLILLPKDKDKRMEKGKILAVDPGTQFKKEEVVYFQSYSLNPVEIEGKEVYFIKADDILAKV